MQFIWSPGGGNVPRNAALCHWRQGTWTQCVLVTLTLVTLNVNNQIMHIVIVQGGTVVLWLPLSPHSKKGLASKCWPAAVFLCGVCLSSPWFPLDAPVSLHSPKTCKSGCHYTFSVFTGYDINPSAANTPFYTVFLSCFFNIFLMRNSDCVKTQ